MTELVNQLIEIHNRENWLSPMSEAEIEARKRTYGALNLVDEAANCSTTASSKDFFAQYPKNLEHYISDDFRENVEGYDRRKMQYVESCPECNQKYTDPSPQELVMYLHCYTYKGDNFEYTASWPNWASEHWNTD